MHALGVHAHAGMGPKVSKGKGRHNRQWRLSMLAFLNRNERQNAGTIEVAERSESPLVAPAGANPLRRGKQEQANAAALLQRKEQKP